MRKNLKKLLLCLIAPLALITAIIPIAALEYENYSVEKTPGDAQFDFEGNYEAPELTIDGIANEAEWTNAPVLATYSSVTVKAFRGEKAIFFFFNVVDNCLLTVGNANDDSVTRSDSIELYIDTLNDGGLKPQSDDYQFNFGIHNKTRIMQGSGSNWGAWNGLIDYEVKLDGTLNDGIATNDNGYAIEVMIPYAQVNIQKTSTIGISFGRVNKSGIGDIVLTDWNWYGWTYAGKLVEPQTIDNYISYLPDGSLLTRDQLPMPNASITGTILNKLTTNPVQGVLVATEGLSTTTDANGYFVYPSVDPEKTYVFDVTKDGYYASTITYTRQELRDSKGGVVNHSVDIIEIATADKTALLGKVVNVINGNVSGAKIEVVGTTFETLSDVSGDFTIQDVPVTTGSVTIRISKSGYVDEIVEIPHDSININGETNVSTLNLSLRYNTSAISPGGAGGINSFDTKITRSLVGVRFHLVTTSKFEGPEKVILYLQGGVTGVDKAVGLTFSGEGTIGFDKPANATFHRNDFSSIVYKLKQNDNLDLGAVLDIEIPYAYLFMTPLEPFGLSAGVSGYNTSGSIGWDGLGYDGFIDPDHPEAYIRSDYLNNIYKANSNAVKVTITGTTGAPNATVKIGSVSVVANSSGAYSIIIDKPLVSVTITFSAIGYNTLVQEISSTLFASSLTAVVNVSMTTRTVGLSGLITDTSGTGIPGATVTVTNADGLNLTTTTNSEGEYTINGVPTFKEVTVTAAKDGYVNSFTTVSVTVLNNESETKTVSTIILAAGMLDVKGTVTSLYGPIKNANISILGNGTAISDESGAFTVTNVGLANLVITVTKTNYKTETINVPLSSLTDGIAHDLGNIDLKIKEAETGTFGGKNANFSAFKGFITRGITGFEFRFESTKDIFVVGDRIELFVSAKQTNVARENAGDAYLFNLNANGNISIVDWRPAPKNETKPETMTLDITRVSGASTSVLFKLPYSFFGQKAGQDFAPTEVLGISIGQWSSAANDWDGWSFNNAGGSANNNRFTEPNSTTDYARISKDNILYNNTTNNTFNFDEYAVQFGTDAENSAANADKFFVKVSRDASSITWHFIGLGEFTNDELVLLYLDINGTHSGSWNVDMLYKIRGNGNVYRNAGAWWSASEGNKVGTVEITRADGFTTFDLTLTLTDLGITDSTVVGFACREALHNSVDHQLYDPWFDCYYRGAVVGEYYSRWLGLEKKSTTGIDAANENEYVKISSSGSLSK
jgi:hypothetical protein